LVGKPERERLLLVGKPERERLLLVGKPERERDYFLRLSLSRIKILKLIFEKWDGGHGLD